MKFSAAVNVLSTQKRVWVYTLLHVTEQTWPRREKKRKMIAHNSLVIFPAWVHVPFACTYSLECITCVRFEMNTRKALTSGEFMGKKTSRSKWMMYRGRMNTKLETMLFPVQFLLNCNLGIDAYIICVRSLKYVSSCQLKWSIIIRKWLTIVIKEYVRRFRKSRIPKWSKLCFYVNKYV